MRILAGFILLFFGFAFVFAQSDKKVSLLIKNCEETEGICETQHLFRYDFVNGEYVGKEKIISTQTHDVRFDLGGNELYRNRYVITRWGDVIDIVEKKVLHDSEGELHRIEGDKIFIEVTRENKQGLYLFDLQTKEYSLYRKTDKGMFHGDLSLNGLRSAWWYCPIEEKTCGFDISELGDKSKFIKADFNSLREFNLASSDGVRINILWLDDERFLTQRTNGELVIVSVKGKIKPLLKIKTNEPPDYNPYFYRDVNGKIIYVCNDRYIINVEKKSYQMIETDSIGNGFSVKDDESVEYQWGFGNIYFFDGKEIGRAWADRSGVTDNFLAVIYGEYGKNLGYPDGVKVWNNIKKDWTTIEIKWSPEIIGWITESPPS